MKVNHVTIFVSTKRPITNVHVNSTMSSDQICILVIQLKNRHSSLVVTMNIHYFIQRIFLLIHLLIAPRSIPSITLQQPKHHWDQILASWTIRTVFESRVHRTGWKLKSFFMISIHLFELTYVRRVKMSFSIMICVYDEYWYVSPREDKASRKVLRPFSCNHVLTRTATISKDRGLHIVPCTVSYSPSL